MYERFTDYARRVMQLANEEAKRFNHEYIGTEHILLGMVACGSGDGVALLNDMQIALPKIRVEVEKLLQSGPERVLMGKLPQTPRAKKVIEYAMEEARNLNHPLVCTGHMLLGLLRETQGVACVVLVNLGVDIGMVRDKLVRLVAGGGSEGLDPVVGNVGTVSQGQEGAPRVRYERYTDRARKVMQLANQEAQRFNHDHVSTEHILLGLVKEGSGVAANALKNLDIDLRKIRLEVEKLVQSGPERVYTEKPPFTPLGKTVLFRAETEARDINCNYVGTEHLILALIREREGVAGQVLMSLGLMYEVVREAILNLLGRGNDEEEPPVGVYSSRSADRPRSVALSLDPGQGREYALGALPDDLDYAQFLASELAVHSRRRQVNVPGRSGDRDAEATASPEVAEMDSEIERLNREKEEAVNIQDFEKAAAARDEWDRLRKKRAALLAQMKSEGEPKARVEESPGKPISLSGFAPIQLKLFRAQEAMKRRAAADCLALVDEAAGELQEVVKVAVRSAVGELKERLEFASETAAPAAVASCRTELDRLEAPDLDVRELVAGFTNVQREVHRVVFDQPKLLYKVNVFKHGVRAVHAIGETDTTATLQTLIKTRFPEQIDEYLYQIHSRKIPLSEVRIRVYPDVGKSTEANAELSPDVRLIDIPSRDIEGVTCYPEWTSADSSVYRQELRT